MYISLICCVKSRKIGVSASVLCEFNKNDVTFIPGKYSTVKPRTSETSKEFIKCRLDNFSIGFILLYLNLSTCKNV